MQPARTPRGEPQTEETSARPTASGAVAPALIITQPHELPETVQVSTSALRQLLFALTGPQYLIRELQVSRSPLVDNPIDKLVSEFNAQIAAHRRGNAPVGPARTPVSLTDPETRA